MRGVIKTPLFLSFLVTIEAQKPKATIFPPKNQTAAIERLIWKDYNSDTTRGVIMSKEQKMDEKILGTGAVPKDITPDELRSCLKRHGITERTTKGSHVVFEFPLGNGEVIPYPVPLGGRKTVNPIYIREIRKHYRETITQNESGEKNGKK